MLPGSWTACSGMKLTAGGTACSTHSTMKDPVRPVPYRNMSGSTMVRGIVWITTGPLSKAWEKNPWGRTFILLISQRKNSNKLTCPERTRSEEHTSALQSLMRNSYTDYCLKQKNTTMIKLD